MTGAYICCFCLMPFPGTTKNRMYQMSSLLHSNQQLLSTRLVESETVFHNDSEWVKRGSAERFDTCLQSEPYVKSGKSWPAWQENTKNVTEGPGSDAGCQFKKDLSLRSRLAGGSRFIHIIYLRTGGKTEQWVWWSWPQSWGQSVRGWLSCVSSAAVKWNSKASGMQKEKTN